jgi:TonB family protein
LKIIFYIALILLSAAFSSYSMAAERIDDIDYLKVFYCYKISESPQLAIDLTHAEKEAGTAIFIKYLLDDELGLPTGNFRKKLESRYTAWAELRMKGNDEKLLIWFRENCVSREEVRVSDRTVESDHDPIPDSEFNDRHQPEYPTQAVNLRHQGTAIVLANVDAEGRVVNVRIEATSGFKELDDAAKNATEVWRFEPAVKGGKKIPSVVRLPVNFHLQVSN